MATLDRTLQKSNWLIYAGLLIALLGLLWLSPAEATLGNIVKIVYAHGAAQRVAAYAYLIAGGLGVAHLAWQGACAWRTAKHTSSDAAESAVPKTLARWTQAVAEAALLFWLIQFVVSAPAQVLAWGAFTLSEPRVASALWILALTALVYGVARWIGERAWMAFAAIANTVIFLSVMRGAINILHPIDPILGSDSPAIKIFYAAIVIVTGLLAAQFARDRAHS